MCGYTFLYSKKNLELNRNQINHLKKIQSHRGPDNSNFIKNNNLYFFHNRLKILDLSNNANQPFVSEKFGNVIVFNGEIYNYKALARDLLADEPFLTNSDTEVILKIYEKYGIRGFEKLNGIFSFVIFDNKTKEVISCRDRFGVKPLYYYEDSDKLIFSTELKPILYLTGDSKYNTKIINEYIHFGLLHHKHETFFKHINHHETSIVKIYSIQTKKFVKKIRFWRLSKNKDLICKNSSEYNENYKIHFQNSLKFNLISDVEVGLLLSSGLDSRYIYKNLNEMKNDNLQTFTFGWKDKKYSETEKLIETTNIPNKIFNSLEINFNNLTKNLEEMILFNEGPIGGFGTYGIYKLLSIVNKKNIKVLLTGEGSDEFNLGYLNMHAAYLKEIVNQKQFKKELYIFNKIYGFDYSIDEINKKFVNKSMLAPDGTDMSDDNINEASNLEEIVRNYAFNIKLPKLLSFLDKSGGAHGIESRFPFLDHNLVQFTYSNPSHFKIINGQTKANLSSYLENFKNEKKLFVATPQREYIKKNYKLVLEYLSNGTLEKYLPFKFNAFERNLKTYANQNSLGNSFFVWKMINLESFFRNFEKLNS